MNIIQTQELTKNFNNLFAVDRIDLAVPKSSIYGFLGPNGAGKTTTIRMLLGLIKPSYGQVSLFGRQYLDSRVEILKRLGALVGQPALYPHLTGWENLEIIRQMRDLEQADITEALEAVNLKKDSHRLVKHYSTGMRQRLGLAMALMGTPQLLILDEPTNGLDPAGIHEIRELITKLANNYGITIFLSSHLLSEVEQVATRIGIINKGRLIFQGSQEELQVKIPNRVVFDIDDLIGAEKVFLADGRQTKVLDHSGRLAVAIDGKADAANLSRLLLKCDISINEMRIERPSLEELFLDLTGLAVEG